MVILELIESRPAQIKRDPHIKFKLYNRKSTNSAVLFVFYLLTHLRENKNIYL